jgi:L-ascorbate metabolism protein UlaG (beta-lactamase superfamily)
MPDGHRLPPPSDHWDGERFFNPGVDTDHPFADFWRWRRTRQQAPWPRWVADPIFPPPPRRVTGDAVAATFIGHATWLLQLGGVNLLTDPVFSERASPVAWAGPRRVRAPGVALAALPPIDLVLLSHNHYDHMDLPSLRALRDRWRPLIVTGLGNGAYLERQGIRPTLDLDWWQHVVPHDDLRVTYAPAQHWSRRTLADTRRMLWGGHVVETPAARLFFAGDTGYPGHFRAIRNRLGAPDIALLPIGAYEPRWFMRKAHMNPEEAVHAHRELGASLSLAMHFGTFPLTDEAIDAPLAALATALREQGVAPTSFRTLGFGETLRWRRGAAAEAASADQDKSVPAH